MNITKCDICKKTIKGDSVTAGRGFFHNQEFCEDCGKPVLNFLKKYKFINTATKEKK